MGNQTSDIKTRANTLSLIGGRLCLDFANTVDWHASDHPEECLTSYSDLVAWSHHAGILTDSPARRLVQKMEKQPAEAASVYERAIVLREAIFAIFSAIARDLRPSAADLNILNETLSLAMARLRIVRLAEGFAWDWANSEDALDFMLWPIVRSAAELLTSEELHWIGECADSDGCGWLFLDTSRNHSRRWCDIKGCGNRAKARRHYERKRALK